MNYSLKKYYFNNLYCRHTYQFNNLNPIKKEIFGKEVVEIQQHESNKEIFYLILKVSDSIQSKFINEEFKYSSIYETYIKRSNQKEHSLENFKSLIKNYELNELKKNKVKIKKFKIKNQHNFLVVDGLHRLSVYYHKINSEYVKSKYVKIVK